MAVSQADLLRQLLSEDDARSVMEGADAYSHLQPLVNLGYLNPALIDSTTGVDAEVVNAALQDFISEARVEGYAVGLVEQDGHWVPEHGTDAWLQALISVEGEFPMDRVPALGELSLWTRVMHYRLWVFTSIASKEVHPTAASQPWSAASLAHLEWFRSLLSLQMGTALRLLGDVDAIVDKLLDSPHFFAQHPHLAVFQLASETSAPWKGKSKKRFLKALAATTSAQEFERLETQIRKPSLPTLDQFFHLEKNQFLLRLTRVFQWVNGYYHGDLGPHFAEKSFRSLLDITEVDTRREFQTLVVSLKGNYWGLNILALLRRMDREEMDFKALSSPSLDDLGEALEVGRAHSDLKFAATDGNLLAANLHAERAERRLDLARGFHEYRGTKGFLRTALQAAQRFWDWLGDLWERVKQVFKNITRFVLRAVRRAYQCLADGLAILLGNRTVSTADQVVSRFDFDFDMVTVETGNATDDVLAAHGLSLLTRTHAMYVTLGVVGKTMNLIFSLSSPIGWVKLGFKIAGFLQELVGSRFGKAAG